MLGLRKQFVSVLLGLLLEVVLFNLLEAGFLGSEHGLIDRQNFSVLNVCLGRKDALHVGACLAEGGRGVRGAEGRPVARGRWGLHAWGHPVEANLRQGRLRLHCEHSMSVCVVGETATRHIGVHALVIIKGRMKTFWSRSEGMRQCGGRINTGLYSPFGLLLNTMISHLAVHGGLAGGSCT